MPFPSSSPACLCLDCWSLMLDQAVWAGECLGQAGKTCAPTQIVWGVCRECGRQGSKGGGRLLKQGSTVGLSLTEVKRCSGREPEAPHMKKGNGGSGRRLDCLFWILTYGLIRTPFLNMSLVHSWLPPCICYCFSVPCLLATQCYRFSLTLLWLNS